MPFIQAVIALTLLLLGVSISILVGYRINNVFGLMSTRKNALEAFFLGYFCISTVLHFFILGGQFHSLGLLAFIVAGMWSFWTIRPTLQGLTRERIIEAAIILFAALAVTLIILGPAIQNARKIFTKGGRLLAHIDLFHHGSLISQLAHFGSGQGSNIFLFGFDMPFYHYGLYSWPALIAWLSGLNGTLLLLYIALPLGCVLLFLSAYNLISIILPEKKFAAILIASAAIILFDPSRDFLVRTHLFDKSYLLAASPGVSYGASIILWAFGAVMRDRSKIWIIGLISTCFLFAFRANFLPLLWASLLGICFINFLESRVSTRIQFSMLLSLAAVGTLLSGPVHEAIFGAPPALDQLYPFMQTFVEPTNWRDLADSSSRLYKGPVVVLAALGPALISLLAITFFLLSRLQKACSTGSSHFALLITVALIAYLAVVVASWTPHNGDFTELNQRPFLPANVLISILALCTLWDAAPIFGGLAVALVAVGHAVPSKEGEKWREFGFPAEHPWHQSSYKLEIPRALVELSGHLAGARATYAFSPVVKDSFSFFPEALVSAISEQPTYLSRPGLYRQIFAGSQLARDLDERIEQIERVINCAASLDQATNRGARLDVIVSKAEIPCLSPVGTFETYRLYGRSK